MTGLPIRSIVKEVGITQLDNHKELESDPMMLDVYDHAVNMANNQIANALFTKAKEGDIKAILFWMKSRAGWHESVEDDLQDAAPRIKTLTVRAIHPDANKGRQTS